MSALKQDDRPAAAASAALQEQYAAIPRGAPVRLRKRTSNLFRQRSRSSEAGLDMSAFASVFSIDPDALTADVGGLTTYEDLVEATLAHGLMPLVVPQLKTITLGGAVTGLGIEASSLRNGMPHESVIEMDVLTGDGRVVTARADNEHADLFRGFPNSYGTLGYALRLKIQLEPVKPYVRLRHQRFDDPEAFFAAMSSAHTDFVDGTVFGPDEMYVTRGEFADSVPSVSDYTGMGIYYRSLQQRETDHLTTRDYLWRWDTDWFWCSRAFGVQNPRIRRLVPKRLLRSDSYWKLVALERRYGPMRRIDRLRGVPAQEYVIQDIEVPVARAAEFFRFMIEEIPILPFWVCPVRLRDPAGWDLYALEPDTTYVNFGFWSTVPLEPGQADGDHNRRIEDVVEALEGRKSLYSTSFYEPERFWKLYNGSVYGELKRAYDPEGRLLDLYEKCVANG